jgi:hypothetical protein
MGASQYEYETSPIIDANVDDRLLELDWTFDHLSAIVTAETIVRKSGRPSRMEAHVEGPPISNPPPYIH